MNHIVTAMVTLLVGLASALGAPPTQEPVRGVCYDGQLTHLTYVEPLALARSGANERTVNLPYRNEQRVLLAGNAAGTLAAQLTSAGAVRFEPAGAVLEFDSGPLTLQDISHHLVEGDNQVTLTLANRQESDRLWLSVFSPCTRYRAEGYPNPHATAAAADSSPSVAQRALSGRDAPELDAGTGVGMPTVPVTPLPTVTPTMVRATATHTATPVATATATAPLVAQSAAIIAPSATTRHQPKSTATGQAALPSNPNGEAATPASGRRAAAALLLGLLLFALLALAIGNGAAQRWRNSIHRWF